MAVFTRVGVVSNAVVGSVSGRVTGRLSNVRGQKLALKSQLSGKTEKSWCHLVPEDILSLLVPMVLADGQNFSAILVD